MSSLQDKLYNYEQTPPPGVWEKVAAALNESNMSDEFPSKLYNAEVIPPSTAWDKIQSSLGTEIATPAPAKRRVIPILRYAAAAVAIGIIAFGIVRLISGNNNTPGNETVAGTKDSIRDNKGTEIAKEEAVPENNPANENTDPVTTDMAVVDVKATKPKKIRNDYATRETVNPMEPVYAFNEHIPNHADRYITLLTPEGNIIRMSKKWGDMVCCVSGEEQDKDCIDQLKKWQQKLAATPSSSGNFMDILSMVSSLSDNEL